MNGYLKQSTASQVRSIGPFVDDTDFKTLEDALSIANTDVKIKKNGGASASKNSGGATADGSGGLYHLTWDATDTATVGELYFSVKVAGALVVFGSYTVLEEAVYDSLFGASAPGYITDQPVNVTKWAGTTTTTGDIALKTTLAKTTHITGFNDISTANVNTEVDTALADIHLDHLIAVADPTGVVANNSFLAKLVSKSATATFTSYDNTTDSQEALRDNIGTAGAGLSNIGTVATVTNVTNLHASAATAASQTTINGKLDVIDDFIDTEAAAIKAVTDKLDTALVLDGAVYQFTVNALELGPSGSGASAASIADAVWDEVLSGHLTAGTTGAALNGAGSAGDPWTTALPGAYGSGTAGKIIGDNINATISSRATPAQVATELTTYGALKPTTAGRTLDVTATGEAGIDWANIGGPTTAQTLSGTTVGTVTNVTNLHASAATAAGQTTINGKLDVIDDFLDTEVAAIKAKTDNLPTDPADASDIAASFTTVNGTLATIAGYVDTEVASVLAAVDTEVAAIKAKTDNLPTDPADASDIAALVDALPTATENADALLKRDMSAVTGESARSPLNALRFLRNKWDAAAGVLTVKKEDDSTTAWTATLSTNPSAEPITGTDPA